MGKAMTTATTCETSNPMQAGVIACLPHLRAFAMVLVGDRERADKLVRDTIVQSYVGGRRHRPGVSLKVRLFAALRKLHYFAPRQSLDEPTQGPEPPSSKENGPGSGALLRIFRRLSDEQREALILAIASGLSYEEAAEVCDCRIDTIKIRVSDANREMSRLLQERRLQTGHASKTIADSGATIG
jgi:RNA polymerase sigma-70 factor, ECF subfamily